MTLISFMIAVHYYQFQDKTLNNFSERNTLMDECSPGREVWSVSQLLFNTLTADDELTRHAIPHFKLQWTIWRPSCVRRVKFCSCTQNASYFCCFPICYSLPDNCDRFQVPLQGIFALKVLWRVISSSAVRMGRSILTAAWRVKSSWIFLSELIKLNVFWKR